ncbi:hypothetical protein NKR23_g4141 [Pleurostoma richardsiae]|uniref:Uncharacterized protein n=1 Tax=Pleurostoma richardsiae TaxID=41990 RepID=A0AA38VT20_9PEZI|nr:hypothetical protein NKR23_g4141 [Pleurostoma richardsiae]
MGESKLAAHGVRFYNWPGGEGPAEAFGISHALVLPAGVQTIMVGGQLGIREDDTVSENIEEEVTEAFEHVARSLKAAGLGDDAWEYVYEIQTFEVAKDGQGISDVVIPIARKFLKQTKPTWTGVQVKALVHPDVHIEITVKALLPN